MDADKPFLPEHVPEVGSKSPASKRARVVGLWVVLVVAFFAIWTVLGNDSGSVEASPVVAAAETCTPPLWYLAIAVVMPALLIILGLRWFVRTHGWLDGFNASQEPGILALAEGRFAEAALVFRTTERTVAKRPLYRSTVALNVGEVLLWSGDTEGAIAELVRVEKAAGVLVGAMPRLLAAVRLGMAYGILGDVESAERWTEEARNRMSRTTEARLSVGAKLCCVESMLLCRRGRFDDAVKLLDRRQSLLMAFLDCRTLQSISLLRMFAAVGAGSTIEDAFRATRLPIEQSTLTEHAKMMASWPEMVEFLRNCPVSRKD